MSAFARIGQNTRFKSGWILLMVVAVLMTLNHFMLIFVEDEVVLFVGYTAFTLYALIVVTIPFRQLEKWAWYTTWILPLGLAIPAITIPELAIFYYSMAALCVLGLLLTRQEFFDRG